MFRPGKLLWRFSMRLSVVWPGSPEWWQPLRPIYMSSFRRQVKLQGKQCCLKGWRWLLSDFAHSKSKMASPGFDHVFFLKFGVWLSPMSLATLAVNLLPRLCKSLDSLGSPWSSRSLAVHRCCDFQCIMCIRPAMAGHFWLGFGKFLDYHVTWHLYYPTFWRNINVVTKVLIPNILDGCKPRMTSHGWIDLLDLAGFSKVLADLRKSSHGIWIATLAPGWLLRKGFFSQTVSFDISKAWQLRSPGRTCSGLER